MVNLFCTTHTQYILKNDSTVFANTNKVNGVQNNFRLLWLLL